MISIGCFSPAFITPISGEKENFGPNNVFFGNSLYFTSISPLFSKYAYINNKY